MNHRKGSFYKTIKPRRVAGLIINKNLNRRLEIQALLDSLDLLLGSLGAALVAACTLEAGILHLGIELNLWLCT
jgi:hypothetical protein